MRIYIPTRARYASRFLRLTTHPLHWLTPELRKRAVFVVRDDELVQYQDALRQYGVEVLALGNPPNLSQKRVLIAQHAAAKGETEFCMCDDDVNLYIRKSDKIHNMRYPTPVEVDFLFKKMEGLLGQYVMVGVSGKEGNNHGGIGPFPLIRECTRSMRLYAFRTADYLSIDTGRLSEMADFDTILQFLERGLKNAVIFFYAQGQPRSQFDGGCSIYRTSATHDAVCRRLADLHPGFVKLRTQENKTDSRGFGTRTEVTVYWQKAYASSQER